MKKTAFLSIAAALVFSLGFSGLSVSPAFAQTGEPARLAEAGPAVTVAEQQRPEAARAATPASQDEIVVKTYSLKFIDWREAANAARFYVVETTGSGGTLTVMIRKKNIADFEAVLKKLDIERRNIMFRVFTIIAAKDGAPDVIKKTATRDVENWDLDLVLDEIKGLWSFKRYWVEAPSFITVKDGSEGSRVRLVAGLLDNADFNLLLRNVRITGEEIGKRNITAGGLRLDLSVSTPNASREATLIDTTEISVKEKGYLVVGVSGLETAWSGLALILVISAEIT